MPRPRAPRRGETIAGGQAAAAVAVNGRGRVSFNLTAAKPFTRRLDVLMPVAISLQSARAVIVSRGGPDERDLGMRYHGWMPMRRPRHQPPELRAARIAAAAAIIAALVSGASGIFTYVSTQNQIAAEDRRSLSAFQREQRQKAYAEFVANEARLFVAERDYFEFLKTHDRRSPTYDPSATPDLDRSAQLNKDTSDAYHNFVVGAVNLRLVVPPESQKFIGDFVDVHHATVADLLNSKYDLAGYTRNYSAIGDYEERIIDMAERDLA